MSVVSRDAEMELQEACSMRDRARLVNASCWDAAGDGLERGSEDIGKRLLIAAYRMFRTPKREKGGRDGP
jgi:hypothetical protein